MSDFNASDPNLDKVEEYFKQKDIARTLRNDIKDLKAQDDDCQELEKLMKKVKELRQKIKEKEQIQELQEKLKTVKERQDLMKELIRIDLLDKGQDEVKRNGRVLRIVSNIKEIKDEGDKKKPNNYKSRNVFR